jgi:hypothetical protein
MTAWAERSDIVGAFLNPALIAALISSAAQEADSKGRDSLDWPVAHIVAPLVLHRPTREALPGNTRTHLSTWVGRNPLIRASFPPRAASLAPYVSEGIRFGLRHDMISIVGGKLHGRFDAAGLVPGDLEPKARLIGRWLARTDETWTIFALLGVRV